MILQKDRKEGIIGVLALNLHERIAELQSTEKRKGEESIFLIFMKSYYSKAYLIQGDNPLYICGSPYNGLHTKLLLTWQCLMP